MENVKMFKMRLERKGKILRGVICNSNNTFLFKPPIVLEIIIGETSDPPDILSNV